MFSAVDGLQCRGIFSFSLYPIAFLRDALSRRFFVAYIPMGKPKTIIKE